MQKKLLALVATVAMVLSMFAGIAFAADGDVLTVTVASAAITGKTLSGDVEVAFDGTTSDQAANFAATLAVGEGAAAPITLAFTRVDNENYTFTHEAAEDFAPGTYTLVVSIDDVNSAGKEITVAPAPEPEPSGHKYTIQVGTKKFISSGDSPGFQQMIGSITGQKTETSVGDPLKDFVIKYTYVKSYDSEGEPVYVPEIEVEAANGQFNFMLPTAIPAQNIALNVHKAAEEAGKVVAGDPILTDKAEQLKATVEVRYNVTTTPAELKFNRDEPIVVSGKVTDSKGNPVEGKKISLSKAVANPAIPVDLVTSKTGEFAFVVYNWTEAGEYQLQINSANHAKVTVAFGEAKLTVTPNSGVYRKVAQVEFTVEGSGYEDVDTIEVGLKKGDTPVEGIAFDNITGATVKDGAFKATFNWTPQEVGTYTLTVKRGDYRATATITVTNPVSYNLINGTKLEELGVGNNDRTFGKGAANIHLVQFLATGDTAEDFFYSVYVDGKLANLKGTDTPFDKLDAGTVNFATKKLGTKTIKVVAYAPDKDNAAIAGVKVFEKTFTAKVVGWDVTLEPTELTVKKAQDVVVVVKDDKGAAINNATIQIVDVKTVAAGSSNVQNGTYTLKDIKVNTPGTQVVKIWKGAVDTGTLMAQLNLEVVGDKVYSVTSDVEALLQGKAQDVKLTVTKDGVAVIPQRVKWVYEDGTTGEAYPSYLGDGVSKVEIKALKAGEIVVRAENFDGTLCGETTIEVVAPQLVLIDEEAVNVTENFKTTVNFKVVDPRDGSAIKSNLALAGKYADIAVYDANDGIIVPGLDKVVTVLGDEEYTLTIMATNAKYETAEDDEKVVAVVLKVNDAELDAHFEVKEATISSDPGMIVIGANNNLTITFADANGKPIVGKQMYVGTTKLDKTDEDGQVIYPVSVATTGVVIKGDTDAKDEADKVIQVEHTIKIGYDAEAPKVTYEVNGDKATIIITDNVRLVRINIAGKEIDFWPGAKYEHKVTLKPGVNKFAVKAQDSNDNVLDEVVEIEYKTDSVVLKDAEVKRQGEFVFVQLRQFEEIGAQVGWKQATRTATFIVGDTKVEVTIGSTTAMVNGKAVTMPAAPFIANDRTYVPTRFIAEALGWNVHWAAGDIITITLP